MSESQVNKPVRLLFEAGVYKTILINPSFKFNRYLETKVGLIKVRAGLTHRLNLEKPLGGTKFGHG